MKTSFSAHPGASAVIPEENRGDAEKAEKARRGIGKET